MSDQRPAYYITTPIYYPSGKLHVGHAYTTVAADFLARYKRQCGYDTWFLTGMDEHGIKIMRSAAAAGSEPQAWVDRAYEQFVRLWRVLEISNDDFIRTTEPRHKAVVGKLLTQLYRQGDIYKGAYEGHYCAPCETFWLERQLVEGNCPDCGRAAEWVTEEAYFFRMSSYQQRWLDHVEQHPDFIQPATRRNEMINFVKQGLEDLCVSRTSFTWGIPVPFAPGHVVYVWLDALTNYISALNYGQPDDELFRRYWPADVHLMAKEIVRFHAIIWPIILMAAGIELPRRVFGHGWLMMDGDKISKSKGHIIDPEELVHKYGLDALRYFLLREVPFGQDGVYTEDALRRRTNVDLANDLGNLLHRTLAMVERFAGGRVPEPDPSISEADRPLAARAAQAWQGYQAALEQLDLPGALGAVMDLVGRANKHIDEQQPWTLARDPAKAGRLRTVLYDLLETARLAAVLLNPALRRAPAEILRQLGLDPATYDWRLPDAARWGGLPAGLAVQKGGPVFPRIEAEAEAEAEPAEGTPPVTPPAPPPAKAPSDASKAPAGAGAAAAPGGPAQVTYDEFMHVDLRVARVLAAEPVAGADRLLRIQIELDDGPRQIVAGIAQHYRPEDIVGKHIIVVANLAPAKIRGQESRGMLLAASHEGKLTLVVPEQPMPPGSKVK
jgi:methionyl-tRNA synthetase